MMLQPGDTLAGYRIEEMVGIGGMGIVYRATQMSLERTVALKVLATTLVGNRSFRERFRREGRHAAALDHPNIIPVYEAGESNGLMFLAMRFVDGPTLSDRMIREDLTGAEALAILRQIASALDAAHGAELVHRDVKPQNILITASAHPYLADFGITKGSHHDGLTKTGDFVGSLSYAAPEQIEGVDLTGACDNYALAAVLYQCLTGAVPYERETDAALINAHLNSPPPSLRERGFAVSDELDGVFVRGMAKLPAERFQSASEFVAAAESGVKSSGVALDKWPTLSNEKDTPVAPVAEQALPVDPPRPPVRIDPSRLTLADRQRPGSSAPESPAVRRALVDRRGARVAVLVAGALLALAAPVAGYALTGGDDVPEPRTARAGAIAVQHGPDWTAATGGRPPAGLVLKEKLNLRHSSGAVLTAGELYRRALGPDPAPKEVRAAWAEPPAPVRVRLGSTPAVSYTGELKTGGSMSAYFVATSGVLLAITCTSAVSGPEALAPCADVVPTLALSGVRAVDTAPQLAVGKALNVALAPLAAAREKSLPGLKATSARTRAAAADALAGAHETAGRAIASIEAGPAAGAAVTMLGKRLTTLSDRLERIASAARGNERGAYRSALNRLRTADTELDRALDGVRAAGYAVG